MITSYKIKKLTDQEEVLILYLDINQEFSMEWLENIKDKTLKDFIKYKNITWKGTKVMLVIGGTTLALLNYNYPATNGNSSKFTYVGPLQNVFSTEIVEKINDNLVKEQEEIKTETVEKEELTEEKVEETVKDEVVNNNQNSNSSNNNNITTKPSKVETSTNNTSTNTNNNSNNITSNKPVIKEEVTPPDKETSNENVNNDNNNTNNNIIENKTYITVHRSNGQVVKLELNEYLIGVVAGEMPASFNKDALKVQAIIARTYVLNAINKGIQITDTTSTQKYIDTSEMKSLWGSSYNTYYNKIKDAVTSTDNLVATYNGNLIECVYHSTSNGKTEDSANVWGNSFPYLQSVDSSWDKDASSYFRSTTLTKGQVSNKLGITKDITEITILSRNQSGRVDKIKVNDNIYTGIEFRTKLGLRSTDFDITIEGDNIKIDTRGYGHGVGLSQYGANGMAKDGYSYDKIIKHYYKGVKITNYK